MSINATINCQLQMFGASLLERVRGVAGYCIALLVLGLAMMLNATPAAAQASSTFSNTTNGAINSTTVCTNPLVRNFTVSSTGTVADINIGILATHTWRGDLQFTLQSPTGTRVRMTNGDTNNVSGDNFNVLLDDAATQVVNSDSATGNHSTSAPPYQNTFRPRAALSAFNGQSAAGTWRLEICDLFPTADNGTFVRSDLYLTLARQAGVAPALTCPNQTIVFDWDAVTWTAGSTSNTYALGTLGNIGFNLTTDGAWLNNATFGGQSPVRQNGFTGGLSPSQFSLGQVADQPSRAGRAVTTITLPAIMRGAQFTIFDVDSNPGQFADLVTVEGRYQGANVTPTLTNGSANYVIGNSAYGDGASDNDSSFGNVVVTFSQPIDRIIISYGNHAAAPVDPGQQGIALHDITFCRPDTTIALSKTSRVIDDMIPVGSTEFNVPGALIEYCLLASNTGDTAASNVLMTDAIPPETSFVSGSIRSGTGCANATTVEDDDGAGADESDPRGAQFVSGEVRATTSSLAAGASVAFTFQVIVD
ncbi:proprotein convertase P-domain-containing protein [Qipengyuania sp. G39]|uniref:Proprotein convertase P-domain-containing protein n=1 Tax=Qipengyuania profundimaris TaxID=3067652 RepID=A0ABT9HNV5_9SPHN|nr:proprotein convertase P-domain-containing protein [Qipengyuania sp. G39]MDP4574827.1 proprotein convertase P-domain-containing protein [Qipengyuania sp. G39]